jgi:hypothetical protein
MPLQIKADWSWGKATCYANFFAHWIHTNDGHPLKPPSQRSAHVRGAGRDREIVARSVLTYV